MGVALVLAVDIANSAAKASFKHSAEQIRGTATHRIVSDLDRVSEATYINLFKTPGSPPIAPVIAKKVRVEGYAERFQLIGIDMLAEANFRRSLVGNLSDGPGLDQWLVDPEAVMISRSAAKYLDVKVDDYFNVSYQGKDYKLKVKGISELDTDSSRSLLVVDIATAQRIVKWQNFISYIDVIVHENATTDFKDQLPDGVSLVDIGEQTQSILGLSAAFELNLTAMSLLGMLVGIFLIYNAISFSIVQRRNLLGRLRSLGVTAAQIYWVILLEALMLGFAGTIIGLLLGALLGQQLTAIVAATISDLYYNINAEAISLQPLTLLKAGLVGILATLIAAWIPAIQASRTKPLTTLSRAAFENIIQKRLLFFAMTGVVIVTAGFLITFILPGDVIMGFIGLFVIIIGSVLMIPIILSRLSRILSLFSVNLIWQMAVKDLDRHISRLATATAALMLALSTSIGIAIMVDSMRTTVEDWLADLLTGDLYIAPQSFEDNAYLSRGTIDEMIKLDAVDDYSLYRNFKIQIENRKRNLIAAKLSDQSRKGFNFIQGKMEQVWADFDNGAVIISEPLAYRLKLNTGDKIRLMTLKGEKPFPVAGVFRDFASEHGRLFIHLDEFQRHWQDQRINTMALFSSSLSSEQLEKQLYDNIQTPDKIIMTRSREVIQESMLIFDRTFRITEVLRLLSIFVAFIGIFSALMAILLERKKEFAILRALGLTQKQISQLILIESVMLGLIAALFAVPVGMVMAWVLTDVIQYRAFGWSMPFQLTLDPVMVALLLGALAASIAAIYPAWLASRRHPAPFLRED